MCSCDLQHKILSAEMIDHPWPHQVVDNIFCNECFSKLVDKVNNLGYTENNSGGTHRYSQYDMQLHSKQILDIVPEIYKLYPHHRTYKDQFCLPFLQKVDPGTKWNVHDEAAEKTISIIVYVKGSIGTKLYTSSKEFVKEVEWKENRALIFCPKFKTTYHSYEADQERVTLNMFVEEDYTANSIITDKGITYNTKARGLVSVNITPSRQIEIDYIKNNDIRLHLPDIL